MQLLEQSQMSMTMENHPSDVLGPLDNLLRYGDPEETQEPSPTGPPNLQDQFNYKTYLMSLVTDNTTVLGPVIKRGQPGQQQQQQQQESHPFSKIVIDDLLNQMFKPRIWTDPQTKKNFEQKVSLIQCEREELKDLQEELQAKLKIRQARELRPNAPNYGNIGICPIREDLYNQLFDEIIRQCTINCPERGLLLLRVRDELKMTLSAYQTLYQGSIVFATKKQVEAEEGMDQLRSKIDTLQKKRIHLLNKKILMESNLEAIEQSFAEIKTIESKKKTDELAFLKQQSKHLEMFLKTLMQSSQQ